jgi:hypothetical protein
MPESRLVDKANQAVAIRQRTGETNLLAMPNLGTNMPEMGTTSATRAAAEPPERVKTLQGNKLGNANFQGNPRGTA